MAGWLTGSLLQALSILAPLINPELSIQKGIDSQYFMTSGKIGTVFSAVDTAFNIAGLQAGTRHAC